MRGKNNEQTHTVHCDGLFHDWSLSKKLSLDAKPLINKSSLLSNGCFSYQEVMGNATPIKAKVWLSESMGLCRPTAPALAPAKASMSLLPLPFPGRTLSASYARPVLLAFRIIEFKLPIGVRAGDPTNPFKVNINDGGSGNASHTLPRGRLGNYLTLKLNEK